MVYTVLLCISFLNSQARAFIGSQFPYLGVVRGRGVGNDLVSCLLLKCLGNDSQIPKHSKFLQPGWIYLFVCLRRSGTCSSYTVFLPAFSVTCISHSLKFNYIRVGARSPFCSLPVASGFNAYPFVAFVLRTSSACCRGIYRSV